MGLIIFDGDDTLWDTSSVFYNAQLNALRTINTLFGDFDPIEEFSTLRMFDDYLIQLNNKPEYDFTMLFLSLIKYYKKNKEPESVITDSIKIIESRTKLPELEQATKINNVFQNDLQKIPKLYDDTVQTLEKTREQGHINVLMSEGNPKRIQRILKHYELSEFFENMHMFRKTPDAYKEIISKLKSHYSLRENEIYVVGDLLDRDVYYGNLIQATTFHKPGGYKPDQKPRNSLEIPDFTIKKISEVLKTININESS